MLINDRLKFVGYLPGRTGSTSLSTWIIEHYPSSHIGPEGRHYSEASNEHKNYFKFATIRNPYTNIVSHYQLEKRVKKMIFPDVDFEEYVLGRRCRHFLFVFKQLDRTNIQVDKFLRTEHLEEDAATLPFVDRRVALQRLHAAPTQMNCKFTREMIDHVISIGLREFQLGGYSTECPPNLI